MTLSLGNLFTPGFDSDDAKISIRDFSVVGAKKEIHYTSEEDFIEHFFVFVLGLIQPEYSEKYINNQLNNGDIFDIKKTLLSTNFTNKQGQFGMIAETMLRDYRSNSIIDNYLNDHIDNGIVSTTHPGADLIEIIKEGDDFLILSRDARNNATSSPQEAITSKLIALYGKKQKRSMTRNMIDTVESLLETDKVYLKTNIHLLNHKQIIFLFSRPGDEVCLGHDWLEKRKEKNITGEVPIIEEMIRNGDYDQHWICCFINDYNTISGSITNSLFNEHSLEVKLRSHAAI